MDPRLLRHYNQELQHLREMGAEFAAEFPKIAGRLGLDGMEVADPYVERLLEGCAFLTARVQVRLDAEFPRFTQRLLEVLYPQFTAPVPSMLVAQVQPKLGDGALAHGVTLPRGTVLRGAGRAGATACEFRTAAALPLWPVEVSGVEYTSHCTDLPLAGQPGWRRAAASIRIRLRCPPGTDFAGVAWQDVRLHCAGHDATGYRLHELLCGHALGTLVRRAGSTSANAVALPEGVASVGFDDAEAMLPVTWPGFGGYRLMQEYFSLPQRFLFLDLVGAGGALQRVGGNEAELVVLLDRADPSLQQVLGPDALALHCVPAANLFERRCDRIHVSQESHEFHVVPDRTRPTDFEVHHLVEVTGYRAGNSGERRFLPLYGAFHGPDRVQPAYYTVHREPRMLSPGQQREGARSGYVGSEVFLSIVDPLEAPFADDLRQLGVRAMCSNRDLPLLMAGGRGGELQLEASAPVQAVRLLRGPSRPLPATPAGRSAWKLINQFSLHQLSLSDTDSQQGAAALRQMLRLYLPDGDAAGERQVAGLRSVSTSPVVRRLPMAGPIAFGRGVQIDVEVEDAAFEGGSAYLLGCVLERFFSRHVGLNAFTLTRLHSPARGPIFEGKPRCGARPML